MSAGDDTFQIRINNDRCTSVGDGRRCQLWRDHRELGVEHAAAWSEPKRIDSYRRGRGGVAARHWIRWDDDGAVREVVPGSERLPWACMGVA